MEAESSAHAEHWGHQLLCHPLGSSTDWPKNSLPASGCIHGALPGTGRRSILQGEAMDSPLPVGRYACLCPVKGLNKLPSKKAAANQQWVQIHEAEISVHHLSTSG